MPSKMVTDRQKSARAVEQAAEIHAGEIAAALEPRLTARLSEGETLPDLALLQRLLARDLAAHRAAMVAADVAQLEELADDADPRRRRDEAAARVYDKVVAVRETLDGIYGPGRSGELVAIEGTTSQDPVVLLRQAEHAVARLRDPGLELPTPRLLGISVEPAALADEIEPELSPLRGALDDVGREAREAESTLAAKTAALAAYDLAFGRIARLLEALFATAGAQDLADRVRPSARHPGQTELEPEAVGEGEEAGEAGAEPSAGGAAADAEGALRASNGAETAQ